MISLIKMPKLSPTMEQGTLVKWHKQVGDKISFGDVLLEISTDKAVLEHNANQDGWLLEILVKEGEKALVATPLAVFSTEKDAQYNLEELLPKQTSVNNELKSKQSENASLDTNKKSAPLEQEINYIRFKPEPPLSEFVQLKNPLIDCPISPLAKRLADERNLDVSGIQGSGPGGRIMKKDLDKAPVKSIAGFGYSTPPKILPGSYKEEPLSPIREVIAQRLQAAKATIPHFYVKQTVNATQLLNLIQELKHQHIRLSINDCIVRACALALKEFPEINSGFNSFNNTIVRFETIDISIAVAIPNGIITPIVRCADCKNVGMISSEIKMLVNKAKEQTLKEHEYKGGSFCISNLGMTGITEFTAIINPPQSAILAVGGVEQRPIIVDNQITIGSMCNLTLSVDHRVIDGFPAVLFMKRLQKLIESPAILLLT